MGDLADRDDASFGVPPGRLLQQDPERSEAPDPADLEVVHEELRVAEEELSENRAQLQELAARFESGQRWREHLFGLLPVGVVVTDHVGTVHSANGAAAALLGVRPALLTRKPLLVYVDAAERRLVRDLLAHLARGEPELRASVTLRARCGELRPVELIALPDPATCPPLIRWLLVAREAERTPEAGHEDGLRAATAIARLCALPLDAVDLQHLLGEIALVVRSAVPGGTAVSVSLGDPAAPARLASDSADAQQFDGLQLQLGEGPCVDAYRGGRPVVASDITVDARWPRLATASRSQSVHSVLALPIRPAAERTGVLNVYGREPGVFAERAVRIGEIVASAVAAVLHAVDERSSLHALADHLERALNSRAVIEQAKGIVMAHHGGTPDEAFARLVAFSSRHNVKLRDVAGLIVQGGGTMPLSGL